MPSIVLHMRNGDAIPLAPLDGELEKFIQARAEFGWTGSFAIKGASDMKLLLNLAAIDWVEVGGAETQL